MTGLSIRQGSSRASDVEAATHEFVDAIQQQDIEWVVFFCSPRFITDAVARILAERLPGNRVLGCSSAGEIGCGGYQRDGISGFSLGAEHITVTHELIPNLQSLTLSQASGHIERTITQHRRNGGDLSPHSDFGFMLVDGLSGREEMLSSALFQMTQGIPQFGGSAGDELTFHHCHVYRDGEFHSDAALLALIHTDLPFKVFMHQCFEPTEHKLVVTEADPNHRIVMEFNAEPAAEAYAELVGVDKAALNEDVFARYPVMVRIGGREYVRSILRANPDDSLTFYCAIDEGLVLTLAQNTDMVQALETALGDIEASVGPPDLLIGLDCILRRTAMSPDVRRAVSDILQRHKVIGFNTYGEQINGMHVNQTLTGVAIGQGPPT
ncbi:FIST N-terminal domain-containing protein [Marinobacteraceae bacterium S3BR75-40.1]